MKTYKGQITKLEHNQIFVFGSNTQGRHGKGAALWAKQHAGAKYGNPQGLQGQSYAILTKDLTKQHHPSIPKDYIIEQIHKLYIHAIDNPERDYLIAYSAEGMNLNGYTPKDMAKMFASYAIPNNIIFEDKFSELVKNYFEIQRQGF